MYCGKHPCQVFRAVVVAEIVVVVVVDVVCPFVLCTLAYSVATSSSQCGGT